MPVRSGRALVTADMYRRCSGLFGPRRRGCRVSVLGRASKMQRVVPGRVSASGATAVTASVIACRRPLIRGVSTPVMRPAAAVCPRGAGVTADATRPVTAGSLDSYPMECAGFGPRSCADPSRPAPAGLVLLMHPCGGSHHRGMGRAAEALAPTMSSPRRRGYLMPAAQRTACRVTRTQRVDELSGMAAGRVRGRESDGGDLGRSDRVERERAGASLCGLDWRSREMPSVATAVQLYGERDGDEEARLELRVRVGASAWGSQLSQVARGEFYRDWIITPTACRRFSE